MHLATIERDMDLGPNGQIAIGKYLFSDEDAAQFMQLVGGGECKLEPVPSDDLSAHGDLNGKRVLVVRSGRFGDLVLLTPALREIKRRWPDCILCVSAGAGYKTVLAGLPYIDEMIEYPVRLEQAPSIVVSLEPLASLGDAEKSDHMTDIFAMRLGLGDFDDKKPDYCLSEIERQWAYSTYPRIGGKKRVAIHFRASAYYRTYPAQMMSRVIEKLHARKWELLLLGGPNDIQGRSSPDITICPIAGHSFRESCSILGTCDVFLGPDSSLLHIAGALDIPGVGLFGPTDSDLRIRYSPSLIALQGEGKCSPCHFHPHNQNEFPADGPCANLGRCTVLSGIDPGKIVQRVEMVARKPINGSAA